MTEDRDPFERLAQFVDPEPDPVVMNAVIAQSRDAFANRQGRAQIRPSFFSGWLTKPAGWLAMSGAVAAAVVLALAVVPHLNPVSSPGRDMVADSTADAAPDANALSRGPASTPSPDTDTRMGMQPPPAAGQASTEPLPQVVSSFEGDGVRIGTRLDAEAMEIYLPDIAGEAMIDAQSVMPGEKVEIAAAFQEPDTGLIAVQFQVDDTRFWRIYDLVEGTYRRDPERSKLASSAADRAEVEQRLMSADL